MKEEKKFVKLSHWLIWIPQKEMNTIQSKVPMSDVPMTHHLTSQSDLKVFLVMMQHKLINLMKMVKSFQSMNQWEPWTRTRTDPGWSRKRITKLMMLNYLINYATKVLILKWK